MEFQAFLPPDFRDRRIQPPCPLFPAELADYVLRPSHADTWHVGVEQERTPDQFIGNVRPTPQGPGQPAHTKVTPGANKVMHNLNAQPGFGGRKNIHGNTVAGLPLLVIWLC